MKPVSAIAAGAAALATVEATFRYLEPALPTHRLWYDTLPAIRVQQMRKLKHVDVVFGGHSMVHCGIQPQIVLESAGLPTLVGYNAGLHRGFYGVVGPFLIDAVIPMLRPSVVALGASIFDLNDNGVLLHETQELYERALLGRRDAVGALARRAADYSALFRNKGALRRPTRVMDALRARLLGGEIRDEDVRDSRHNVGAQGEWLGYANRGFHTTDNMRRHLIEGGLAGYDPGGRQVAHIQSWIRRIQTAGPHVVLVLMPPSSALKGAFPDGENRMREATDMIRRLGREVGIVVLEPASQLVDEEHYADLVHLNRAGMEVFSTALGISLAEAVRDRRINLPSGQQRRAQ